MEDRSQDRSQIEALPSRAALGFEIETAAADEAGHFRVTGVMNSFGVMHSGRILHPRGFEAWLKRSPNATLPMLANHGSSDGFATIGVWDSFQRVPGNKGMRWSGYLAKDVPLADQARTLLQQRILRQLSLGWITRQSAWVTLKDTDLDEHFRQALTAGGVGEALGVFDWYPIEGSVVDVADDPAARMAAGAGTAAAEATAAVNKLIGGFVEGLDERVAALVESAVEAALGARAERSASLCEAYQHDFCLEGAGGDDDGGGEGLAADPPAEAPDPAIDKMLRRLRRIREGR
jgi:hypothetical protein